MAPHAHAVNVFEDLSGAASGTFDNPYDALIVASHEDPKNIQARYQLHRTTRNSQQKLRLLDPGFPGVSIDPILLRLVDSSVEPGYRDPRHCLVFWARPTERVKELVEQVQQKLVDVAPNMWLMPRDNLHLTVLEITHSRTDTEIRTSVEHLRPHLPRITDYTFHHRARLIKPMISYDASALAISFVPAAGEALPPDRTVEDDKFTHHHLRRDLYGLCEDVGVDVDSRYVVPSSHLTIGRFIRSLDFEREDGAPEPEKMKRLVERIEELNAWLEIEYWPNAEGSRIKEGGEWIVGEEKGLDCQTGTLWYGNGERLKLGKGF